MWPIPLITFRPTYSAAGISYLLLTLKGNELVQTIGIKVRHALWNLAVTILLFKMQINTGSHHWLSNVLVSAYIFIIKDDQIKVTWLFWSN